jgi:hypothetical protein
MRNSADRSVGHGISHCVSHIKEQAAYQQSKPGLYAPTGNWIFAFLERANEWMVLEASKISHTHSTLLAEIFTQ